MSEGKFPLIEGLGITVYAPSAPDSYISAQDLERVLSEGVEVTSSDDQRCFYRGIDPNRPGHDLVQGLVIGLKPIERDTADKFVKDMHEYLSKFSGWNVPDDVKKFEERAKKLVGK